MNSDPSGTDADSPSVSDGEPVIDIFLLSKDARDSRQLVGQLTDQGYRITPFSESFELLDRLRMGKPNLLICNAAGPEEEGYQACREIKADEDLWNIPVLLITGVSSLGDLLIVLDSNADNFIARPWDAQYLGSLIELMLASPVEKPDPEKIRTQFKIRHEDREYVITADRRKLLEFLLSSFEIAMNRASDLSRVVDERDTLTSTLESRVSDRTRELSTEVARLQTETSGKSHELDAAAKALAAAKNDAEALRTRISENEKALAAKADELARANEDLESTRAHLAEEEDAVRTLGAEKEELEHALRGDVESVNADLEKTRAALAEAQKELAALSAERTDLGQQLDRLGGEHEDARKSLAASAIEIGQLKSDLATEKNRADTAEQEVKSILQEKAKSEEELRQMIGDITAKATQQSQEVMRLSDQLGAEQKQRESVEQDFLTFRQESEKKEAGYIAERDSFFGHHDELQQKYDALTASLGAEREKAATREGDVERLAAEKRQLENDLLSARGQIEAVSVVLDEEKRLRAAAELNAKNGIESKNDELRELAATIDALRSDLDARGSELSLAGKERDEAQAAYKDASDRLAAMELAKGQADKLARSAAVEMEQAREQLETERRLRHGAEENAAAAEQAKENIGQNLRATLEAAESAKRELQKRIDELSGDLENERTARRTVAETLGEARSGREELQARLADVSRELENERTARKTVAETLGEARSGREELQARLADVSRELEEEREARKTSSEKLDQAMAGLTEAAGLADRVKAAESELTTAQERQRSLEEQLRTSEREQAQKEAAFQTLTEDLGQISSALAAEKDLRRAAEHAYEEIKTELAAAKTGAGQTRSAAPVVTDADTLPVVPVHETVSPVVVPGAVQQALAVHEAAGQSLMTMEDFFEEPKELDIGDLPDAVAVPEQSPSVQEMPEVTETPNKPVIPGIMEVSPVQGEFQTAVPVQESDLSESGEEPECPAGPGEEPVPGDALAGANDLPGAGDSFDEEDAGDTSEGEDEDTAEEPEEDAGEEDHTTGAAPAVGAAFDRRQWLDLIKWAHHAEALRREDRIRIVKLGRLIQSGRHLTKKQEDQLSGLVALAEAMGYRPKE